MRNQQCFCGSGKKTKKCHNEYHHKSSFAEIIKLHKDIDERIETQTDKSKVKCKKGCHECCKQLFVISPSEFYYMLDYYITMYGLEKTKELIEKGYNSWLKYEENNPNSSDTMKKNIEGVGNHRFNNYIDSLIDVLEDVEKDLDIYCPFLDDETKSCSVYDARPSVCRLHGVSIPYDIPVAPTHKINFCSKYTVEDTVEGLAEVGDLTDRQFKLDNFIHEETGQHILERSYPIIYFLRIIKNSPYGLEITNVKIKEFKTIDKNICINNRIKRLKNRI